MSKRPDDIKPGENVDLGHRPDALEESRWRPLLNRKAQVTYKGRMWLLTEALVADQRDNVVIVYLSRLKDNDTYEWKDWLRPTVVRKLGGFYDPIFMHRIDIPDAVFKYYRIQAINAFLESESEINKMGHSIDAGGIAPDVLARLQAAHAAKMADRKVDRQGEGTSSILGRGNAGHTDRVEINGNSGNTSGSGGPAGTSEHAESLLPREGLNPDGKGCKGNHVDPQKEGKKGTISLLSITSRLWLI